MDRAMLAAVLQRIWEAYNGIRHSWQLSGWPFDGEPHLNDELLSTPGHKILFLVRKNLLRRIVSHQISAQTQVWSYFDDDDRRRLKQFEFAPINLAWVESHLARERDAVARYRQMLARRGDFVEVAYEDFYDPARDGVPQMRALTNILQFLGHDAITEPAALALVAELFDAGRTKLNSAETYRLIPGIEELEANFGSSENGWLFR